MSNRCKKNKQDEYECIAANMATLVDCDFLKEVAGPTGFYGCKHGCADGTCHNSEAHKDYELEILNNKLKERYMGKIFVCDLALSLCCGIEECGRNIPHSVEDCIAHGGIRTGECPYNEYVDKAICVPIIEEVVDPNDKLCWSKHDNCDDELCEIMDGCKEETEIIKNRSKCFGKYSHDNFGECIEKGCNYLDNCRDEYEYMSGNTFCFGDHRYGAACEECDGEKECQKKQRQKKESEK